MNRLVQHQDAALRRQERELGNPTFLFRGVNVPCIPGSLKRSEDMSIPGPPIEQITRPVTVRKSAVKIFTADSVALWTADQNQADPLADKDMVPPQPGKDVILEGREYVMGEIREDPTGAAWIATLVTAN